MPDITPFLWFGGQAEEAVNYYVSVFANSSITNVMRYGEGGPGPAGEVMTIEFVLDGKELMAINDLRPESRQRDGDFTQGKIALFVSCETQAAVDDLWDKLAAGGEEMPCGWVQDRYGFAWNIVPQGLGDVLGGPDPDGSQRAMQAMFRCANWTSTSCGARTTPSGSRRSPAERRKRDGPPCSARHYRSRSGLVAGGRGGRDRAGNASDGQHR